MTITHDDEPMPRTVRLVILGLSLIAALSFLAAIAAVALGA